MLLLISVTEICLQMELFFSANIVQFVFIAFKLDNVIEWHWAIVFIPLWVVLTLCAVGVFFIFSCCSFYFSVKNGLHRFLEGIS